MFLCCDGQLLDKVSTFTTAPGGTYTVTPAVSFSALHYVQTAADRFLLVGVRSDKKIEYTYELFEQPMDTITAVMLGCDLVYELTLESSKATLVQKADLLESHANPSLTSLSGTAFCCGGAATHVCEKYDSVQNRWRMLPKLNTVTMCSACVFSDRYLYCVHCEGYTYGTSNRPDKHLKSTKVFAERMDLMDESQGWTRIDFGMRTEASFYSVSIVAQVGPNDMLYIGGLTDHWCACVVDAYKGGERGRPMFGHKKRQSFGYLVLNQVRRQKGWIFVGIGREQRDTQVREVACVSIIRREYVGDVPAVV